MGLVGIEGAVSASVASLGGLLAGIGEIVLEQDAIDAVDKHLTRAEDYLHEAEGHMNDIARSGVGGSTWGRQLSHHSTLANDRLLETLGEMRTGLDYQSSAVRVSVKGLGAADQDAVVVSKKGSDCIGASDTSTPTSCVAP